MHTIIKKIVKKRGTDVICSNILINCIDDEGGFSDVEMRPFKKILKGIVADGYSQKLLDIGAWNAEIELLAKSFAQKNMLQEDGVLYVFSCLAFGLGWLTKAPKFPAEAKRIALRETQKKAQDAEVARKKAEKESRQKIEDAARKKAEAAEHRAKEAEKRALEAERKARAAEVARKKAENDMRLKIAAEERKKAEAEARIKAEEAARQREIARQKAAKEAQQKAEEEAQRKADELARLIAIGKKNRARQKSLKGLKMFIGISLIATWVILLIVNAAASYLLTSSWFNCIFAGVATFFAFYGIMNVENKVDDEHPIDTESPTAGTIAHIIWRIIWVLGLSAVCEIILVVLLGLFSIF